MSDQLLTIEEATRKNYTPFEQGKNAWHDKHFTGILNTNPYPAGSPLAEEWSMGWDEEEEFFEKA